jgi:LAO/AO transport system kinase
VSERPSPSRRRVDIDALARGITEGDRAALGRAITLIESTSPKHAAPARELLTRLMPRTGSSIRLGITGVPGVGKSTFIDAFGTMLTGTGKRVAVLAVDPSSGVSGGSILGDKTRMARLCIDDRAFIRPSPSAGTLGGVASRTRETILVCEAGGFDVVLVETVGVGQSETVVHGMTDLFVSLMLPGAGDELQGIKRGLLELVDLVAVNKADGDMVRSAERAASQYRAALHMTRRAAGGWTPPVLTCSAKTEEGLAAIWDTVRDRHAEMREQGVLAVRRREQDLAWMWSLVESGLRQRLRTDARVSAVLEEITSAVRAGELPPTAAADRVLGAFDAGPEDTVSSAS